MFETLEEPVGVHFLVCVSERLLELLFEVCPERLASFCNMVHGDFVVEFVQLAFFPAFDGFSFHIGERGGDSGIWDAHLFVVSVGCFEESECKEKSVALCPISREYLGRVTLERIIAALGLRGGRCRHRGRWICWGVCVSGVVLPLFGRMLSEVCVSSERCLVFLYARQGMLCDVWCSSSLEESLTCVKVDGRKARLAQWFLGVSG